MDVMHPRLGLSGAVVTNNRRWAERARCVIDCCGFYWDPKKREQTVFAYNGARASEFEGAILNAQLDRIGPMIRAMRRQKKRILKQTVKAGLIPSPANSLDWECGTHVLYRFEEAEQAATFADLVGGTVALNTGRHVYTEWDPVLRHLGAHHPALNPYNLAENRDCRMDYTREMCARSLDILARTVFITTHPDRKGPDVTAQIRGIKDAARQVLGT
jgi:dTDP-4-amino-4,6-dideoxygalactose transaminase